MSKLDPVTTHLAVQKRARIVSSAPWTRPASRLWYVLHGYGQRAEDFLEQFEPIADEDILIVAPEGLSRLYLRATRDEIGASWMTSRDRDIEIEDYLAYLDAVHAGVMEAAPGAFTETIVLGFSQGAATASRWVSASLRMKAHRLILWGALPGAELRSSSFAADIAPCRVEFVTGTQDRFTSPDRMKELLSSMDTPSNPISLTVFEGGHEIDADTLQTLARLDPKT